MELIKDNGQTLVITYTKNDFKPLYLGGGIITAKEARKWLNPQWEMLGINHLRLAKDGMNALDAKPCIYISLARQASVINPCVMRKG